MSKTLELIFLNAANKPVKLQIPDLTQDVSEESARNAMNTLLETNVLNPTTGKPVAVKSAQIIEKETHTIF